MEPSINILQNIKNPCHSAPNIAIHTQNYNKEFSLC